MNRYLKELKTKILRDLLLNFGYLPKSYPEKYAKIWTMVAKAKVIWVKKEDRYLGEINGHLCFLHLNKKPEDPRYTLCFNQKALLSFKALPKTWQLKG